MRVLTLLSLLSLLEAALTCVPALDIDYAHNVVGRGTLMTDFKMGSEQSTEATGRVRGTGEVVSRYLFQTNASENITIYDRFLLDAIPEDRRMTPDDYPQIRMVPGGFRLIGASWAEGINLSAQPRNSTH